jgi:hypothetical protein
LQRQELAVFFILPSDENKFPGCPADVSASWKGGVFVPAGGRTGWRMHDEEDKKKIAREKNVRAAESICC